MDSKCRRKNESAVMTHLSICPLFFIIIVLNIFCPYGRYTDDMELDDAVHTTILTLKEG